MYVQQGAQALTTLLMNQKHVIHIIDHVVPIFLVPQVQAHLIQVFRSVKVRTLHDRAKRFWVDAVVVLLVDYISK